jgi:hypothetical protein
MSGGDHEAVGGAHPPRLFTSVADIVSIGEGLLARTLPRERWTHEAHLAATVWLVRYRRDIALETEMPDIIRRYNEAVGGINDDTQGYHETLTQFYIGSVRAFIAARPADELLGPQVNALLAAPEGDRGFALTRYSRNRLFSVAARRGWVAPDL